MKISMEKLIANKYLLWTVFGLTIVNVLGYLANNQYNSLTFMVCVGLLTSFFNKNMTVVLLVAVLATALVNSQKIIEGMTGEKDSKEEETRPDANISKDSIISLSDEEKKIMKKMSPSQKKNALKELPEDIKKDPAVQKILKEIGMIEGFVENMEEPEEPKEEPEEEVEEKVEEKANAATAMDIVSGEKQRQAHKDSNNDNRKCYRKDDSGIWQITDMVGDQCDAGTVDTSTCQGIDECKSLVKSGFSNMKSKNAVSAASTESRVDGKDDLINRIDSKSTMNQTMNNLGKMIGKGGIKGLTKDTRELLDQQKELVKSLGQMAPILKGAKSTLDSLDLPDISGLSDLLKGMNGN